MIVEIGHFALALALGVAVVQSLVPLWGVARHDRALASVGSAAAVTCFLLVALAFAALVTSYVRSDFSVENVVANSHSTQPLIYKLTSVWGNHEGSMLLWVLILTLFGALVAVSRRSLPVRLRAGTLAAQGM
ncbi:MAG: heme lyase NrfEFG subunit NrfE, partial [Beijerinckiaceae bacterium]|nr:heme lyase NrfEFG subunit NrfE [Beijerinckiaceae bacterium]